MAIKLTECELTKPLPSIDHLEAYTAVHVLVRQHGQPLGHVQIDCASRSAACITPVELRQAIAEQLGWVLVQTAIARPVIQRESVSLPPVTVLVYHHDADELLSGCLDALAALDYPEYEILIIAAEAQNQTANKYAGRAKVRFISSQGNTPGQAYNQGIAAASYDLVACTSTAARPDPAWLSAIVSACADPDVAAVTGPVLAYELVSPIQLRAETQLWSTGLGFRYQHVPSNIIFTDALLGLNLALRRSLIAQAGGFNVTLRAGVTQEFCQRLLASGYSLVYAPAALVRHIRPHTVRATYRMAFAAGQDAGAYLLRSKRQGQIGTTHMLQQMVRWIGEPVARDLLRHGSVPGLLCILRIAGVAWGMIDAGR